MSLQLRATHRLGKLESIERLTYCYISPKQTLYCHFKWAFLQEVVEGQEGSKFLNVSVEMLFIMCRCGACLNYMAVDTLAFC